MSSTSEASRPAMRMPSTSAADLIVIVIARDYPTHPVKSRVSTGHATSRPGPSSQPEAPSVTHSPKHLLHFEGGNALSAFRAQALLPRLQAIQPRISGVSARHVHWVWSEAPLAEADRNKVEALLRYGDPYAGPADGPLVVVAPRLGTVSPWASKATDIAHNCGLAIKRVERVTEFR